MNLDYLVYAGLWVLYFGLHSLLAVDALKKYIMGLGVSANIYRFLYVLISFVGLFLVIVYGATIKGESLVSPTPILKFVGLMMATFAIFIIKQAFQQYKLSGFLGLAKENPEGELRTTGILNRVRHPLYSAIILLVAGFVFFQPKWTSIIFFACTMMYLAIGIYLEERKLIKLFGDRYVEYKKRVPGLIPRGKS